MSVLVCRGSAVPVVVEKEGIGTLTPRGCNSNYTPTDINTNKSRVEEQPKSDLIWSIIRSSSNSSQKEMDAPYVHPLMRRSSSLMSQKSLEMCTESLGSETGSDDFSSDEEREQLFSAPSEVVEDSGNERLRSVNYHSRRNSSSLHPPRSFPPPLPSLSRRDGPCLHMRPHRRDGRLVMEAVPVPSHNYLHARRHNGRLLLAFVDSSPVPTKPIEPVEEPEEETEVDEVEDDDEEEEEEEEEEEVEVVDRGTVVEVKVSTQPQQQSGTMRVHRSSLVINKFVSGAPMTNQNRSEEPRAPSPPQRRSPATTTAAAAAVAASSGSLEAACDRPPSPDKKLRFTSKRRNREEMLHCMRRCSELRRPLFFWEQCCIATS